MTEQRAAQPWAGFWRRVGAFMIDGLVIGAVGYAIGAAAFDAFAQMGQWARLIGLLIAVLYFGLLGSRIGGGQTLGHRVFKLQVRRVDGRLLALGPAVGRAFVLVVPIVANGITVAAYPAETEQIVATTVKFGATAALGLALFGIGVSQVYLLVFNRPSGQLLHDLIFGTVVVRAGEEPLVPPFRELHRRMVIGIISAVMVVMIGLSVVSSPAKSPTFGPLLATAGEVEKLPEVIRASVVNQTTLRAQTSSPTVRINTLIVTAQLRDWPPNPGEEARRVAATAVRTYQFASGQRLTVAIRYGFNIGIASGWRSYSEGFPVPTRPLS